MAHKLDIIFQNADFIAINKPAGMLSIPDRSNSTDSLKELLQQKFEKVFTVHRLDRETSGVIVYALHEESHKALSRLFEERQTVKMYNGLVHGEPTEKSLLIDEPIMEHPADNGTMVINRKGKPSQTASNLLEGFGKFSWMQFQIFTGRTHQIRVHMKHAGHPIVCDPLYGNGQPFFLSSIKKNFRLSKDEEEERPIINRLALHASSLQFTGEDGKEYVLEAPVPKDLKAALQQLRKLK